MYSQFTVGPILPLCPLILPAAVMVGLNFQSWFKLRPNIYIASSLVIFFNWSFSFTSAVLFLKSRQKQQTREVWWFMARVACCTSTHRLYNMGGTQLKILANNSRNPSSSNPRLVSRVPCPESPRPRQCAGGWAAARGARRGRAVARAQPASEQGDATPPPLVNTTTNIV